MSSRRAGLGIVAVSPSPDPVSLAFNAAMGLFAIGSSLIGRGRDEANAIVPQQNALKDLSNKIVDAARNPAAAGSDLIQWRAQLIEAGNKFYEFTQRYERAGPGARRTIFGIELGDGNWIQQPAADAPGYITGVIRWLNDRIRETTGIMDAQLGFDWGRLLNTGLEIANRTFGTPGYSGGIPLPGGGTITLQPAPGYGQYSPVVDSGDELPKWLLPAGLGLVVLLLVTRK